MLTFPAASVEVILRVLAPTVSGTEAVQLPPEVVVALTVPVKAPLVLYTYTVITEPLSAVPVRVTGEVVTVNGELVEVITGAAGAVVSGGVMTVEWVIVIEVELPTSPVAVLRALNSRTFVVFGFKFTNATQLPEASAVAPAGVRPPETLTSMPASAVP
jgi:hypothetical protein